jgi:hypothetical protein
VSNGLARIPKALVQRRHGIHEQALTKTIGPKVISQSPTAKLTVPNSPYLAWTSLKGALEAGRQHRGHAKPWSPSPAPILVAWHLIAAPDPPARSLVPTDRRHLGPARTTRDLVCRLQAPRPPSCPHTGIHLTSTCLTVIRSARGPDAAASPSRTPSSPVSFNPEHDPPTPTWACAGLRKPV